MTSNPNPIPTPHRPTLVPVHRAIRAMRVGLALTVAATIVPFVDRGTADMLGDHIREMYPNYSDAKVTSSAAAYLVYLSIVGVLGVAAWLWTIRVAQRRAGAAPLLATIVLAIGSGVALTNLLIQEQTGDRALPLLYGIVGVLPVLPGLAAVALLWKARRTEPAAASPGRAAAGDPLPIESPAGDAARASLVGATTSTTHDGRRMS